MIKPSLPPFKRWTLENFPFIEDDFDAITNYQLYCKIVEYIKSVDTYMQGVNSFLTEVENYFNNLDVQDEINNKLDEMASDGTLTSLIKNYIDPLINNIVEENNAFKNNMNESFDTFQNNIQSQINGQNTIISSLSNITPIVVSSTDDMTDTEKIYVNTTDGKWYYYNGSAWTIGGTYQSTGIGENVITYKNLDNDLNNLFSKNITEIDIENEINNKKVNITNNQVEIVNDSNYDYFKLDISTYLGKMLYYSVTTIYNVRGLIITDSSDNVLYYTQLPSPLNYNFVNSNDILLINSNMKYLYINIQKFRPINKIFYNIGIVENYKNIVNYNNYTKMNDLISIDNYYLNGTLGNTGYPGVSSLVSWSVKLYRIYKNTKYRITGNNKQLSCAFIITDNAYNGLVKSTDLYEANVDFTYEFTASSDGYIFISYNETLIKNYVYVYDNNNNTINMSNIKIGFTGDSICAIDGGYASILHTLYGLETQNISVSGGHIANDSSPFTISDSIDDLDNNCDGYIIEGGINDYSNSVPLGQLTSNYTDTINQGTFYGALEKICRDLYTYHYGKQFAFLIIHNVNNTYYTSNNNGNTFKDYIESIYNVCKKYGVHVIDISANSSMNTYSQNMKELYTRPYEGHGDGLHPNTLGLTKYYVPLIKEWIDTMFK